MDDILRLLKELDADEQKYQTLLLKQKQLVSDLFFEKPLMSLVNCLNEKREQEKVYTRAERLDDLIYLSLMALKAKLKLVKRWITHR